jgi:hypothetical protein
LGDGKVFAFVVCYYISASVSEVTTEAKPCLKEEDATYASCKKVLPSVYWFSVAALRNGKYRVVLGYIGCFASRSNARYGSVIGTVLPPSAVFPRLNVT